jgi:hypothetical protein
MRGREESDETLDDHVAREVRVGPAWPVRGLDSGTSCFSRASECGQLAGATPTSSLVGSTVGGTGLKASWGSGIRRQFKDPRLCPAEQYSEPAEGYDSTDPSDPIRSGILDGRTVASNGGFAMAQIANVLPRGSVEVPPGEVTVEVRVCGSPNSRSPAGRRLAVRPAMRRVRMRDRCGDRMSDGAVRGREGHTPSQSARRRARDHGYPGVDTRRLDSRICQGGGPRRAKRRCTFDRSFVSPIFLER